MGLAHRFGVQLLLLMVGLLCVYVCGNGAVALWDRDEPRYAQASKQMLESGDWVAPMFLDEPRINKPVGIYWLQAAAMGIFSNPTFAARLPSAVGMTLLVGLVAWQISIIRGKERGLLTGLILGTAALAMAAGKMSITDAVLAVFITAAQLMLFSILTNRHYVGVYVGLGLAVGLAGLVKGPVVLGMMGATCVAWGAVWVMNRKWKPAAVVPAWMEEREPGEVAFAWWKPLVCVAVFAAVLGPWVWMMEQRFPNYVINTIYQEIFVRAKTAQEGHSGPPGYYLLTVWGTYLPWSLLLPAAVVLGWKNRRDVAVKFALCAVVGPWVMLEMVQTKLPHYLLPAFPFLAYLTADALCRARKTEHPHYTDGPFVKAGAMFCGVIGLVALVPWAGVWAEAWTRGLKYDVAGLWGTGLVIPALLLTLAGWAMAWLMWRAISAGNGGVNGTGLKLLPWVTGGGFAAVVCVAYAAYLPAAGFLQLPKRVGNELRAMGAGGSDVQPGEVVMIEFKEPSLAFYQGGTIREGTVKGLMNAWAGERRGNGAREGGGETGGPRWVVTTREVFEKLPVEVREKMEVLRMLRGCAYADGGQWVEVVIGKRR